MRGPTVGWLALLLLGLPRAAAADEPRDVIRRAIDARGGLENLSRLTALRIRVREVRDAPPKGAGPLATAVLHVSPRRARHDLRALGDGYRRERVEVLDDG